MIIKKIIKDEAEPIFRWRLEAENQSEEEDLRQFNSVPQFIPTVGETLKVLQVEKNGTYVSAIEIGYFDGSVGGGGSGGNTPAHQTIRAADGPVTFAADTYRSITYIVIDTEAEVTIDGETEILPEGVSATFSSFQLDKDIIINAPNGEVYVTTIE